MHKLYMDAGGAKARQQMPPHPLGLSVHLISTVYSIGSKSRQVGRKGRRGRQVGLCMSTLKSSRS